MDIIKQTRAFFIKIFEPFKRFKDNDDFSWIVPHNKVLFYEIFQYNVKRNFKYQRSTMIRKL